MNSTTSAESPAAVRTCGGIPEHQVAAWGRRGALAYGRLAPAARESSFDTGQFPRLWLPARSDFYAQPFSSRVHFIAGRRESEKVQQAAVRHVRQWTDSPWRGESVLRRIRGQWSVRGQISDVSFPSQLLNYSTSQLLLRLFCRISSPARLARSGSSSDVRAGNSTGDRSRANLGSISPVRDIAAGRSP
jgi:hypothetical protein